LREGRPVLERAYHLCEGRIDIMHAKLIVRALSRACRGQFEGGGYYSFDRMVDVFLVIFSLVSFNVVMWVANSFVHDRLPKKIHGSLYYKNIVYPVSERHNKMQ